MPLIKPRTRGKQLVRHIARLDRETNETLFAYAQFIGEPTDYVLNQVIDTVLGKDKDFQGWRAEHGESFVPRPGSKSHRSRRATERHPAHQRDNADLAAGRFRARVKRDVAMFRRLLEQRAVLAMLLATGVGVLGVHTYPIDRGNVYLQLIELRSPAVFLVLVYGYATLWFTTPFFALSIVASLVTIVAYRYPAGERARPLPAYVPPERRPSPTLVLGEAHFETTSGRAPAPTWLTIPQRGLYTGVMIVGAVGTGKTSACMYPYAEQLLRWRAGDPDRKIGGLVLEVKGDFCQQVRGMLASRRARIGLRGDSARRRHLLQPAPQRPRPVCGRLCDRHTREQPVRQVQRALLAAGLHRSAQVRHPVAASR